MDSNPMVFDISSDEDPVSFDGMRSSGGPCCDDDHDWLTELLENVDRERADSFDDVVVVDEYISAKKRKEKSKLSSKSDVKDIDVVVVDDDDDDDDDDDGDDDDCVVLDCDPEKAVDVVDDGGVNNDGDDVLVVGQKGQIACRDYPHPRHHCAKYPFSSTPHEMHCELCHCYVCDSLAPCAHWGTGASTGDHCHATDKENMWKCEREGLRLAKNSPLPAPKFPDAHLPVTGPQPNQVAPLDITRSTPNLGAHNKVSRPITVRACSSARLSVPNIISQARNRRPIHAQGRNGFLPRSVSQQVVGIGLCNNTVMRDRGQQFVSSNTMFKRRGIIRSTVVGNQSVYGSSNNINRVPASYYGRNAVPQATVNFQNTAGWQGILPPNTISEFNTCPSLSQHNMAVSAVPPVSEPYCKPVPQSSNTGNIFQYGNQSQSAVDPAFFDFDFSWLYNSSQSNQQPLDENFHHNRTGSNKQPTTAQQISSDFTEITENHYKDHDYESWLLPQSEAVASEGVVSADLNVFSPELPGFDAGMLCFDFETSWNGLAQV